MATKIRFREDTQCVEVLVEQDGYRRLFKREEQPFALSENKLQAEHELRAFAGDRHEYLELFEAEDEVNDKKDEADAGDNASSTDAVSSNAQDADAAKKAQPGAPATTTTSTKKN